MSGRGRGGAGRGRGNKFTFNVENLHIDKSEKFESPVVPPPLYPPLLVKPLPMIESEEVIEIGRYRENLVKHFREHYNIDTDKKACVGKYSELQKRKKTECSGCLYQYDRSLFPAELFEDGDVKKKVRKGCQNKKFTPNVNLLRKKKVNDRNFQEKAANLEDMEAKEDNKETDDDDDDEDEGKEKVKKKSADDDNVTNEKKEESDEDEFNDEDFDEELEETDYANNYFDNGEDYIDDEDDKLGEEEY